MAILKIAFSNVVILKDQNITHVCNRFMKPFVPANGWVFKYLITTNSTISTQITSINQQTLSLVKDTCYTWY